MKDLLDNFDQPAMQLTPDAHDVAQRLDVRGK